MLLHASSAISTTAATTTAAAVTTTAAYATTTTAAAAATTTASTRYLIRTSYVLCGNSHVQRFTHSFKPICIEIMPVILYLLINSLARTSC